MTTPQGREGYVAAKVDKTDLPCPGTCIHLVQAGETALDDIVPKYFTHDEKPGRDGRYYVNVLAYLNPAAMVDPSVKNWRKVEFKTSFSI